MKINEFADMKQFEEILGEADMLPGSSAATNAAAPLLISDAPFV